MNPTPYAYVIDGGVENTRVKNADEEATLSSLYDAFTEPVELDVSSIEYHNADKKRRTTIKKQLPYFIGGTLKGKRHDTHVQARTLLTLDIEQGKQGGEQPPTPKTVVEQIKDLGGTGWVYTSLSHTPAAPRYRVVLPLREPLTGTTEEMQDALEASTKHAAGLLGLEDWCQPESWVLSQAMYLPAKLKGGAYFSALVGEGKAWGVRHEVKKEPKAIADIPDDKVDPVLAALKDAGLYLGANPKHPGMHFITCPCADQHGAENDTQTVYYEAHFDGNPRPAVKCFDTEPDEDGVPHLTTRVLLRWLTDNGHLDRRERDTAGVYEDYDKFAELAGLGRLLDTPPVPREWAVEQFLPVGKVTVLAGPGGVSKSMLMLHILVHGAMGKEWAGFKPCGTLRSLYVSYEDDTQELHGRTHALAKALREADDGILDTLYDVNGTIRKNLLMYAADDDAFAWLLMVKADKFGQAERTERVEWLVGFLKHSRIRCLVLDPAVYTHQLEENSIADMASFMQTLTYIAKMADCAVCVLHHMHKTAAWASIDEVNQGSLRGASSFADNARSVGVLISMPIKDAINYGLEADQATASRYAVFKHVKHNYSASLGTLVLERRGPLLVPAPTIHKLDSTQMKTAREEAGAKAQALLLTQGAEKVLAYLAELGGEFATTNQIALGSKTHKRSIRAVLEYAEEQDWVEMEQGARGATMARITKTGKGQHRMNQQ